MKRIALFLILIAPAFSQTQTETDEYTRYELLAPETASFAIHYEVTATTPGATVYYNPIRKGSVASGESVLDVTTGQPLKFEVVSGGEAVKDSLMKGEETSVDYIKVHLARPVPPEGQARLLILKTYKDPKSYYREGDTIVFNRPLSIPRNSVILPAGYELVSCNVPSQVLAQPDGRIAISFMNGSGAEAPLIVKAKPGARMGPVAAPREPGLAKSASSTGAAEAWRLTERAHQDDESIYFLQQPESHVFRIQSDSTWVDIGIAAFQLRPGTEVAGVSAYVLDTGERLAAKIMTGTQLATSNKDASRFLNHSARFFVVSDNSLENARVRISQTETAPAIFRLDGAELVFDTRLGDPRNAVVLPDGWYLTASSIPATVSQMPDGRIRLDFWNGRPDLVDVLIKAKRRAR